MLFVLIPLVLALLSTRQTTAATAHPLIRELIDKVTASSTSDAGLFWGNGWPWGTDSTVSVVDRSPPVTFSSRPASFGPLLDDPLLGYVIPLSSFTEPCKNQTHRGHWGVGESGHQSPWLGTSSKSDNDGLPANLGCPDLCLKGDVQPDPAETWIALVQRGECPFVKKVREAQKLGAKAVVVGGDDPRVSGNADTLVGMYNPGDSSDIHILSTFIKYSDYVQLFNMIANSNTTHSGLRTLSLQITTDFSSWEWYSPILTFIILLLLPSSLTLATLLIHRVRAARAARRERAPEDIVNNLPWAVWTGSHWEKHAGLPPPDGKVAEQTRAVELDLDLENGGEGLSFPRSGNLPALEAEGNCSRPGARTPSFVEMPWFEVQTECAICLCEFVKGDRVRVLPCQHVFHLEEVDEWLIQRKKLCPVCKADVTQPQKPQLHPSDGDSSTERLSPDPHRSVSPSRATERTPLLSQDPELEPERS